MMKRKIGFLTCIIAILLLGLSTVANAQKKKKRDDIKSPITASDTKKDADSTKKKEPPKLKKYAEVITKGMQSQKGFITVHQKDDKFYFEVPFRIFKKDILAVNRIAQASVDMRNGNWGLVGDQIGESVYNFERGPGNKIFLRRISFTEYAGDSTKSMYTSVQLNNVQAIAAAFPIVAFNPDSTAAVLDVTDFLNSDNEILYFDNKKLKERAGMGAQQNDRSYMKYVHAYPTNLEIRALKTYSAGLNPAASFYTLELNSSLVLLPEKPIRPRIMDERVGYFTASHRDFDADPQGVQMVNYATRWRLEPKPEDVERYLKGELVEPQKPIVFYIDPATPKKWIPYLIQGVNDWQKAFEHAGFKNAIYAREAPTKEEDSTWSLDDARHAAIIYRPSVITNAMGPSVADPRSGEIIESHVFWYHNIMSLLHNWYMVQCGAADSSARKLIFDDKLMGELIRFVSSHEIGHTLGLRHNFGSSSTVPVDSLRSKRWVEKYGHTPSIMDYARFNYVAQPEDHISTAGLFPRINDYDKWAIEWGYRWHPEFKDEWDEQEALAKIVTDSLKNHRLWFGGESEVEDARCQSEDLGDDAMKAGAYGIKNLQRILPHIIEWTTVPYKDFDKLKEVFSSVLQQYTLYLGHVMKNIGGVDNTYKIGSMPGPVYVPTTYDRQKRAVQFINDQLFTTPMWLNQKDIFTKLPYYFGMELSNLQSGAINAILMRRRMTTLLNTQYDAKEKVYTLRELLSDLDHGIFKELYAGKNVDSYRRNLQRTYINRLLEEVFVPDDSNNLSEMQGILINTLKENQKLFKKAMQNPNIDHITKTHIQEMNERITSRFNNFSKTNKMNAPAPLVK